MSRFIVLAILVASANAYQTFTGKEYSATDCSGAVKNQMTIPTGLCSFKLKVSATSTGMSAQLYTDVGCATVDGAAKTQTTAELTAGTCVVIGGSGWKFSTGSSANAYAVQFVWTAPTSLAGSTVYLAADSCFTFDTTKSMKAASTSATQTTPNAWGSSATCASTATETAGVKTSPVAFDEVVGGITWTATITIATLDSTGAITTTAQAGGTNAPTAAANSASQATFPLLALLAAFVVKMVHGL